jgi:hypothetical protein
MRELQVPCAEHVDALDEKGVIASLAGFWPLLPSLQLQSMNLRFTSTSVAAASCKFHER